MTHSRILWISALTLVASLTAGCARGGVVRHSQSEAEAGTTVPVSIGSPLKEVPIGEELEYEISWWGLPVGTATLATLSPEGTEDKKLIRTTFDARSNWALQAFFYPVQVRLSSWMDPKSVSPRKFESYVKRQWRVHESVITFDSTQGTATHELPEGKRVTIPITPATQDGLSIIYYARTIPLALGKTIPLEVTADGKNWPLNGRVVQAGIVRIGGTGYWPALQGEVELAYPVPFFHGAKARVWFSADENRVPLLAKIRSRVGPVTVVLTRRSLGSSAGPEHSPEPPRRALRPQP